MKYATGPGMSPPLCKRCNVSGHTQSLSPPFCVYTYIYVCSLLFIDLTTSKVIAGQVQTCDSAHSLRLYSVAPLGNQAISHSVTLSWQWSNQSLLYPNNTKHLVRKQQLWHFKPLVWFNQCSNLDIWILRSRKTWDGCWTHSANLSSWRYMCMCISKATFTHMH